MATQAKVYEILSDLGLFEIKNYGGYTYNVFLDGQEIDVFTYTGLEEYADFICDEWVEDYVQAVLA